MRAFLLAAGKGTRLRPITDTIPKCLVEINGVPLLEIWLKRLAGADIDDVLINTHHLPDQVRAYVAARPDPLPRITLFHEEELTGSAGTVAANREWIGDDEEFLVVYADNLTGVDLRDLITFHRAKQSPFTIGLFHSPTPEQCGIASMDDYQRIVAFEEKPKHPTSDLANAGIYVAHREIMDLIPTKPVADFGYDILPQLIGKMYGYEIKGFFCDIGTLERLEYARREWKT
jgi:mannose-1-phosphate guanylyltransferase